MKNFWQSTEIQEFRLLKCEMPLTPPVEMAGLFGDYANLMLVF